MSLHFEKSYAVFTVCNLAYLQKALVLAESLLRYDRIKLNIYIIDKKVDVDLPINVADFTWIEDVGIPRLYELAFKYDITEFSTSLKPGLTLKLLEKFEKVIFLDPDICLYHSVSPILNDLNEHSIVVTPHYTVPMPDSFLDSDMRLLRFGSFNLGFYAVTNSDQSLYFLRWWNNRCLRLCFFEAQFGLSTDQKWVSIAPCFFKDLYVSFNLGYNAAIWNAHERSITKGSDNTYLVNGKYPLVFFHFSSFDEAKPEVLSKREWAFPERTREKTIGLLELSLTYKASLDRNKSAASLMKYGFDYMSSGEYISPTLRSAYACILDELPPTHDPFDSNGIVGIFAKKNYLIEKKLPPFASSGFMDLPKHKNKFIVIYFLMRLVLRLIGPNNFANFSRLLVYLSSYRQNRGLWKL